MKGTSFLKSLITVSPEQIRGYLVHNGWAEDGEIKEIATIWHRLPDDSDFEILSPENKNLRDYPERVRDLLFVLAEYEDRGVEDVLRDISRFFADLIRVRVVHDDVEGGTIPLEDGVLLIEKTLEILGAATLSTLSKKRYFSGSRPQVASDFISKARLGQTEVGSYIVNVIAPIDIPKQQLFKSSSFSRLVITTLARSLDAIQKVIDNSKPDNDPSAVDQAVDQGVSANLCDALIGLAGVHKSRDFSISISFSKSEPTELGIESNFSFTSSSVPTLERTSEYLKANYVIKNLRILGMVTKLDRDAAEDNGKVTVTAFVDEKNRNVTFELSGDDYLEAIHAHESKRQVECYGDIHISPKSAKLVNTHGFRVIGNGDLFK